MIRFCAFLSLLLSVSADSIPDWPTGKDLEINAVAAINNIYFGFDFFKNFSYGQKNVFFSPLSINTALSQIYIGARGNTRRELDNHGYYALNAFNIDVPRIYQRFFKKLTSNSDYTLEIANALITQTNYPIFREYKETLQRYYDSLLQEVDFVRENSRALQLINGWVNEKTHGKISKLVDSLDSSTRLVLLNAVYFKGLWATQFNSSKTVKKPFYNNGNNAVYTPMMRINDKFPYIDYSDRGYKVLRLPYEGNMSMIIVLPYERDGVERLKTEVNHEILLSFYREFVKTKVNVTLPKFKLEYSRELSEDFQRRGVNSLFRSDADLSGISNRNLYVSQIVHKAVVEVNEEGSEAAAVTGVVIVPLSLILNPRVEEFHANHPFLFYIVDDITKLVLFMGSVNEL